MRVEPLLLTVEQAAARLSLGRTKTFALIKSGELESVKAGRARRVPPDAVEAYVANLRGKGGARNAA